MSPENKGSSPTKVDGISIDTLAALYSKTGTKLNNPSTTSTLKAVLTLELYSLGKKIADFKNDKLGVKKFDNLLQQFYQDLDSRSQVGETEAIQILEYLDETILNSWVKASGRYEDISRSLAIRMGIDHGILYSENEDILLKIINSG